MADRQTPPPAGPTLPANAGQDERAPFSLGRHRKSLVLIGGCVVLLVVARTCNSHEDASKRAAKAIRQHDSVTRDQGDEADNLGKFRENLEKSYAQGKADQARTEAEKAQAQQQQAAAATLTPEQQERIGQMGSGGGQPGYTAERSTTSPTPPAAPASLIISYRSESSGSEAVATQPAAPVTEAAVQPPPGPASDAAGPRDAHTANPEDAKHQLAAATGEKYRVRQGTWLPCTEELRINGTLSSGINCLVSIPIYSTSGAHLLIPMGTVALGKVAHVGSTNQERLFVTFDTLIMPDGYTCTVFAKASPDAAGCALTDSDGMDQIGQTGLRDKVNHHYTQIFGASLAIAGISGLSQIGNYGTATITPGAQYRAGITQSMSESSMQVLDRFLNVLPTFIISEGARNNIHLPWNLWLPDYANHRMKDNL